MKSGVDEVKEKPGRNKRERLSRERIELAALALVEELGMEGFSTRKLGLVLGCEAMSIYHHFPSKDDLLDALVDRVVSSVSIPPREVEGIVRVRRLASGWRAMALRHPRFFPFLALHRLNSEVGLSFLNEVFVALRDAGLGQEEAARLFRAVTYFLTGAALDEIAGYAKGPSSQRPVSDEELPIRFPEIAAAGAFFQPQEFERTFEVGLEMLLRGAGLVKPA